MDFPKTKSKFILKSRVRIRWGSLLNWICRRRQKASEDEKKNEFTNSHRIFKNKIWERILHETDTFHKKKQVPFHAPPLLAREQNIWTDQQQKNHNQMKTFLACLMFVGCRSVNDKSPNPTLLHRFWKLPNLSKLCFLSLHTDWKLVVPAQMGNWNNHWTPGKYQGPMVRSDTWHSHPGMISVNRTQVKKCNKKCLIKVHRECCTCSLIRKGGGKIALRAFIKDHNMFISTAKRCS